MQRFLAESPWDDDTVIGRLQEYLGPRLGHPEAVWVLDGSDFPKQGRKSVGVARQYCGRLGRVANCQAGMFLAYVSPLGRALVDKRLYLPESWTSSRRPVPAGGGLPGELATDLGGKRCPGSRGRRSTGWCGKCCPGNGSGRISCCGGSRMPKGATNRQDVPMRSDVPPSAYPQTSRLEPSLNYWSSRTN